MRTAGLFFYFLFFAFLSCEKIDRTPQPDPFFNEDKMSDILTDMYLIEGSQSSNRRSFLNTAIRPDSFLYKKYKMDSLTFKSNFFYYTDRPELYASILEQTELKLQKIKDEVLKKKEPAVEINKSLSKDAAVKDTLVNKANPAIN